MIQVILDRLDGVKHIGKSYMAKCPAHVDNTPSLKLTELEDGRILIHCFAECSPHDVLGAIGLSMTDLYPNRGIGQYRGFEQIEKDQKTKRQDKFYADELILEIAQSDRQKGKRLNQRDLAIEQAAFSRVRDRKK